MAYRPEPCRIGRSHAVRVALGGSRRRECPIQTVAPSYVRRVPGGRITGPGAFKERIAAIRTGFPDFHSHIDEMVVEGSTGVVRWSARGRHRGDLFGVPPTGRQVEWSGMTWFRVESGRLVEEWELFDQLELFQGLGLSG